MEIRIIRTARTRKLTTNLDERTLEISFHFQKPGYKAFHSGKCNIVITVTFSRMSHASANNSPDHVLLNDEFVRQMYGDETAVFVSSPDHIENAEILVRRLVEDVQTNSLHICRVLQQPPTAEQCISFRFLHEFRFHTAIRGIGFPEFGVACSSCEIGKIRGEPIPDILIAFVDCKNETLHYFCDTCLSERRLAFCAGCSADNENLFPRLHTRIAFHCHPLDYAPRLAPHAPSFSYEEYSRRFLGSIHTQPAAEVNTQAEDELAEDYESDQESDYHDEHEEESEPDHEFFVIPPKRIAASGGNEFPPPAEILSYSIPQRILDMYGTPVMIPRPREIAPLSPPPAPKKRKFDYNPVIQGLKFLGKK